MRRLLLGLLALAQGAAAAGYRPAFDPRDHRVFAGEPTRVAVLGTPHLSGLPPAFRLDSLGPLLDRLARWRPTLIAVEQLSGAECDQLRRYAPLYPGTFDQYCWDEAEAERATGLAVPAATAEVRAILAAWPAAPAPAARRHLAALFIASGDRASAFVQWLRLPEAERREGDGLSPKLVELLQAAPARRNETYAIAAALAARLGLERVHPVDDHTSDAAVADAGPALDAALADIWKRAAGPRRAADEAAQAGLGTPEATLALYRYHNAPGQAQAAFDSDFGAALRDGTPGLPGRRYADWWQARNLRMAANIQAAAAEHPGARILALVGASHKGYYEAYLSMMHDMVVEDVGALLR